MNEEILNILIEKLYNAMEIKREIEGLIVSDVEIAFRSWGINDAEITALLEELNPERFEEQKRLLIAKHDYYNDKERS